VSVKVKISFKLNQDQRKKIQTHKKYKQKQQNKQNHKKQNLPDDLGIDCPFGTPLNTGCRFRLSLDVSILVDGLSPLTSPLPTMSSSSFSSSSQVIKSTILLSVTNVAKESLRTGLQAAPSSQTRPKVTTSSASLAPPFPTENLPLHPSLTPKDDKDEHEVEFDLLLVRLLIWLLIVVFADETGTKNRLWVLLLEESPVGSTRGLWWCPVSSRVFTPPSTNELLAPEPFEVEEREGKSYNPLLMEALQPMRICWGSSVVT